MATENSSILDVISGNQSLKISIGLDVITVSYLIAGALVSGIILILISKKLIK